jgi:Zn-dependent protease
LDLGPEMVIGLLIRAPVVLFSLTIHEFMHGWVAYRCGDDTAYEAGRLTLNPIAHLDPIGTICLFFAPIGWAKPVPVNPLNYNHPRRDEILVSGAGVTANFVAGAVFALIFRALDWTGVIPVQSAFAGYAVEMLILAMFINFGLAVFNLLPIFPLDGSHIVQELLPYPASDRFREFSRYGPMVLLVLVVFGGNLFSNILSIPIRALVWVFAGV